MLCLFWFYVLHVSAEEKIISSLRYVTFSVCQHQDKAGYYLKKKKIWEKKRNTDYFQAHQGEKKRGNGPKYTFTTKNH